MARATRRVARKGSKSRKVYRGGNPKNGAKAAIQRAEDEAPPPEGKKYVAKFIPPSGPGRIGYWRVDIEDAKESKSEKKSTSHGSAAKDKVLEATLQKRKDGKSLSAKEKLAVIAFDKAEKEREDKAKRNAEKLELEELAKKQAAERAKSQHKRFDE